MTTYTTEAIACGLSDDLRHEATFLLARLRDFEGDLSEEQARDWYGHVTPSMERLQALATSPAAPSHPGEADRVGLGELERLSAAATQGEWMHKPWVTGNGHVVEDERELTLDGVEDFSSSLSRADAQFICRLVNVFRAGHLAPASLAALGTGEGSGGASATPSGHSRAEPYGLGASPECPSRDPWDSGVYDFASSVASKVAALTWALPDTADAMDDRYADVQGIVDAELRSLTGDMTAGGTYRTPAPCDGSGEAGETHSGSTEGDSAVTEGQAPLPLPHPQAPNTLSEVEEAKALLDGIHEPVRLAEYYRRIDNHADADRIEAALVTLRASQEQDGEVSHG